MKIAHVISTFPPHIGGMGDVCLAEAQMAVEHGHDVTVFTLRYSATDYPQTTKLKIVPLQAYPRVGDGGLVPQLFKHLRGFDVVHLHYPFYGGAEWVYLAKRLNKQKYLVTYHMDAEPSGSAKRIIKCVYDFIWARLILFGAEKIIAVDAEHFIKTNFGKFLPRNKIAEIFNPVDPRIFDRKTIDLAAVGLARLSGQKIVLFVGNGLPVKRLDILLDVINKKGPGTALIVIGGGYCMKDYQKRAAALGITERVIFTGPITDKNQLADYYNLADCVAVPSDAESFSLVTAEAMACGAVVVGSDIPGIRGRIFGKNNYSFEQVQRGKNKNRRTGQTKNKKFIQSGKTLGSSGIIIQ